MSQNKKEPVKLAEATEADLKSAGFATQKSLEGIEPSIPKQNSEAQAAEECVKLEDATKEDLKSAGFAVQKSVEGMEPSIPKQNSEAEAAAESDAKHTKKDGNLAEALEAKLDKCVEDISKTVESVEAGALILEKVGSIKKNPENERESHKENGDVEPVREN